MGVMSDRIHNKIILKCYIIKGNAEVQEIASYILDQYRFYLDDNRNIPNTIINTITEFYSLKYTKEELLQWIWDKDLTFIYPLKYEDYEIEEVIIEKLESAQDSPI